MLENIKNYEYDTTLQISDGNYCFYLKELQIRGEGKSIESAYQDLLSKKEKLVKEFKEVGVKLPPPNKSSTEKSGFDLGEFGSFFLKCLVVLFLFVACFSFASRRVSDVLKENMNRLSKFNTNQFEEALYQAATHDISPERQKKIIMSIRTLVQKNKPFVDELKPLFFSK